MIFLSYFEGFGYPPIEALACQTPCIAYELDVLKETCSDKLVLVSKGDTSAVLQKMLYFSQGNADLSSLTTTSYEIANTYSLENYAKRLENIIKKVELSHDFAIDKYDLSSP